MHDFRYLNSNLIKRRGGVVSRQITSEPKKGFSLFPIQKNTVKINFVLLVFIVNITFEYIRK